MSKRSKHRAKMMQAKPAEPTAEPATPPARKSQPVIIIAEETQPTAFPVWAFPFAMMNLWLGAMSESGFAERLS